MSSNVTATNGERITAVVLSGSLFLLIYVIGKRRLEQAVPKPDAARESRPIKKPVRVTEGHSNRYFSHNLENSYPRVSSISGAVETPSSPSNSEERRRQDLQEETSSEISDADTVNPYVISNINAALRYGPENISEIFNAQQVSESERSFLEHLERRSRQEVAHNHARATSISDLSSLEKIIKDQKKEPRPNDTAGSSSSSPAPRCDSPDAVAAERLKDRLVLSPDKRQYMKRGVAALPDHPTILLARPLLYSSMWCILSQFFTIFSTTGMGATMVTFPAPFFKLTVHFLIQSILASCMLRWPMKKVFYTSWTTYLWRVIPVAVAASFDHEPQITPYPSACELRNWSIINLSFCQSQGSRTDFQNAFREGTMAAMCHIPSKCKALVPLIALLIGTRFKLEGQGNSVFPNVLLISVGFMLIAYKEEEDDSWSLTELSLGPFVSTFRLVATENLLQIATVKVGDFLLEKPLSKLVGGHYPYRLRLVSPIVTMRALAPAMALVTAVFSCLADPWSTLRQTEFFNTPERSLLTWAHITVGGLLQTSVALAELVVIYHTSANTMIVVATVKEVTLLTVDQISRGDCTRLNAIGYCVFSLGLLSYGWLRYRKIMKRVGFQDDFRPLPVPTREECSSSATRSCFFTKDLIIETRYRIRTELSNFAGRVSQVKESLRVIGRNWRGRFSTLTRWRRH
ncbi:hypothetical protein R1sor_024965 [Riccia sorocarpa]|uniref:Uncharacterized protein n=1 Tax=Riccia sorocarpa TaxID=122646 RepID=A0ABD3G783_9MARC